MSVRTVFYAYAVEMACRWLQACNAMAIWRLLDFRTEQSVNLLCAAAGQGESTVVPLCFKFIL